MVSSLKRKILIRTGIILPIILAFNFIYKYGCAIPYWDEWELVTLLQKIHNHSLTLGDFWAQHNEHRLFFPKLLMLFLAVISGWNVFWELFFSIVFAAISLYFLCSLLDNTLNSRKSSILKFIISLLLFSMVQYENWIWGWSIQHYMAMTGIIAAIWSINKWQGQMRGLLIAIFAAVLANYSFGSGILIWPAVLFMLIMQKKWKLKHIIIWIIAGFVTAASYYYKHTGSSFDTPMTFFLHHPVFFTKYILCYLGAPLAHRIFFANIVALILLVIILLSVFDIWRLDKNQLRKMIPWLALMLYVVMSALVTGLGRVGLGIGQALSSRYTTISTLFVISAAVLLYNSIILNLEKKKKASLKDIVFISVVSLAFCIVYIKSYEHGIRQMKEMSSRINAAAVHLKNPDNASDDDLKVLYPNPDVVRQRMKILKEMGIEFPKEK